MRRGLSDFAALWFAVAAVFVAVIAGIVRCSTSDPHACAELCGERGVASFEGRDWNRLTEPHCVCRSPTGGSPP